MFSEIAAGAVTCHDAPQMHESLWRYSILEKGQLMLTQASIGQLP